MHDDAVNLAAVHVVLGHGGILGRFELHDAASKVTGTQLGRLQRIDTLDGAVHGEDLTQVLPRYVACQVCHRRPGGRRRRRGAGARSAAPAPVTR